ncbi:Cytochrome c-type biogenesis protein CcmH/NrfG [Prosthecobacter debontii]|uniref:Cytochrome c-type biogenesis protein CcmH/NrfG n=1 Tax=Prosthecobacter debontii TaxID=48467 RepID=A0A1T4Y3J1_9BACT|nr:tetratricopeptide repeat protein [Prosthecobacter debontii]SKA96372.1 Cytochrome c-type biogenesis protein CcmH/NrfG [Prosthecobacter debontii]
MQSRLWNPCSRRRLRHLGLLAFCCMELATAQETPKAWTERETRLANEYLSLLVSQPDYGRVVELLWNLYEKHGATPLLLENISAQAQTTRHPTVLLVQGHLFRRAGDLKKAASLYDEVLKAEPTQPLALRARAEVARELADPLTAWMLIQRWEDRLPDNDPAKPQALIELGTLALAAKKTEEAAQAWEKAARLRPDDIGIIRQVGELLLRAGFPARAASFYETLANQSDPQKRLDALYNLARILEHADEFLKADAALLKGLSLLDFRDARYAEFFRRRVRLHERFGNLDDLRLQLQSEAEKKPVSERSLRDLVQFYEITVDLDQHLAALRVLVKEVPQVVDYRWDLVRSLLDHDGAAEAGQLLDERMKGDGSDLPALIFLRCDVDLRQGRPAEATARLKQLLDRQSSAPEVEKQALNFAQTRTLDAVIEWILQARVQREPSRPEAVFELAGFYRTRKDNAKAEALLRQYTGQAVNEPEKQRRLNDAAAFLASGSDLDSAIMLAREALSKSGAGREELLRLADLLAEHGDYEEAAALLEKAWASSSTDEDRLDVDERLFSVLMGEKKVETTTHVGTAGDFKLPDAFTGKGFASGAPEEGALNPLPQAVMEKARAIFDFPTPATTKDKSEASLLGQKEWVKMETNPALAVRSPERLFRAAWWALRTEMHAEAYLFFRLLQMDPATGKVREMSLEAEKLLLELSLADKNKALTERVLHRLITRDAGNKVRYILRLSELLLEAEQAAVASLQSNRWFRDGSVPPPGLEATALLEQAYRETPDSDQLLSALTQTYTIQRRMEDALKLWKEAVKRASGTAAVPLLERYADLLLRQRKFPEYVQAQLEIVERETDAKRRREALRRFTDRLLWSADGGEMPPEIIQERLKLLEEALTEQTRRHPFDGFYHEALALIYEKKGDDARSFQAMKQAYYTSPETPFSLSQLREAALRVSDLKSAIYFQKQIAASAPPTELAVESRRLVELLEQTFQIAEADRVRRRLESRFSQDATALENLADHYKATGQDEAERRVYEQVAIVRPWDASSQLRIALKCLRLADDEAAERYLREILAKTSPSPSSATERQPLPLTPIRKSSAPGPVTEITALLDTAPGLEHDETTQLRAFLNLQRPEFSELPVEVNFVRLRVVEELAKLFIQQKDEAKIQAWIEDWSLPHKSNIERLWALYYVDAGAEFRVALQKTLKKQFSLENQFCLLWLMLRSHGMKEGLAWVNEKALDSSQLGRRKRLLLGVVAMLSDLDNFKFAKGELTELGASRLLMNASILEITRDLQDQQRYTEALELGESLRRNSVALADDYAFFLSRIAESAERWDLAREYLDQVVRGPILPGTYRGTYDPYLYSLSTASRLAVSEQAKEDTLRAAWKRLQSIPDSALTRLRKSAVAGLAGAQDTAAEEMRGFIAGDFLGARRMGESQGFLAPQGSSRHEEPMHLRGLWEETREIQASFVQQGLAGVVQKANDGLAASWGAVGLSSRSGQEFGEWRLAYLMRQLRQVDFPTRQRMIREYLGSVDMRLEVSVDTVSELGGRLESLGMAREAIDVYRLLPSRAPANPEYAQWLIRASESARETQVGLQFTLQLLLAEPPMKPPQPGDEVLREKHAWFLAQDFNLKELHTRGFLPEVTHVLQGRIPHEVPYLRELALLHERLGQDQEALAAWNRLHLAFTTNEERGILPDAESSLHQARLLHKMGKSQEALESLRTVSLVESSGSLGKEVLLLRADLVAAQGGWDEFRELMAIAVARKSLDAIAHLAELLRTHDRATEALNFLTQGERQVQEDADRFFLRLELLKLMAHESNWTPERGRAQVASLFRARCRDRDMLKGFASWMTKQGQGANQQAWIRILRAEVRAGVDRPMATLALCALAEVLTDKMSRDIALGWTAAKEGDRICVELGAEALLKAQRVRWAWEACEVLQELPTLRLDGRRMPLMVRVAHAMGERATVQEFFAEVIRRSVPGGVQPAEWAQAFEDIGEPGWARELYEAALLKLESTQSMQPDLSVAWVRFLIRNHDWETAEVYLLKNHWTMVNETADLIFELYQSWGKLASIETELPKFHLPEGIQKEVLFLSRRALGLPQPSLQP